MSSWSMLKLVKGYRKRTLLTETVLVITIKLFVPYSTVSIGTLQGLQEKVCFIQNFLLTVFVLSGLHCTTQTECASGYHQLNYSRKALINSFIFIQLLQGNIYSTYIHTGGNEVVQVDNLDETEYHRCSHSYGGYTRMHAHTSTQTPPSLLS